MGNTAARSVLVAGLVAVWAGAGLPVTAQDAYHLRGTLATVADDKLTVVNEDEETFEVALGDDLELFVVSPATLSDLDEGQYVGVAAVESKLGRVALEVHIFAEDLRGTGEGAIPWDLVSEPNLMINATVTKVSGGGAERRLDVVYREGQGDQASEVHEAILVPNFAPVVFLEAAPDRTPLQPEKGVFLVVADAPDGTPTARRAVVGRQGAIPPM